MGPIERLAVTFSYFKFEKEKKETFISHTVRKHCEAAKALLALIVRCVCARVLIILTAALAQVGATF